jgi:hypothetical protein
MCHKHSACEWPVYHWIILPAKWWRAHVLMARFCNEHVPFARVRKSIKIISCDQCQERNILSGFLQYLFRYIFLLNILIILSLPWNTRLYFRRKKTQFYAVKTAVKKRFNCYKNQTLIAVRWFGKKRLI